ncbi:M16 family metallopeptidase [Larkinella rosea]|uniref:Insulinase family protein n=1 Tax=Larkinella rosea TaxID=2025312 RepID=A0A3P1BU09_9BACT|nr:pitrilysin family protein [Larkinella rosea]RRB04537.1 insulinase family protein [Larkinella rosea]
MMKTKYILAAGLLALGLSTQAQTLDRTKLPADAPAPAIKIGKPVSFTLANGLKVFVVQNNKLPRVAFSLLFDYLPIREGDKAGYVSIASQLIKTGTKTRTKDQIDEAVDFIGGSLNTSPTGVYAMSLKKHTPKMLEVMSDVVLNPKFTQEELDKLKKQTKSGLASQKDNPSAIATRVSSILVYGKDHPYGEPDSEETVDRITLDDCRKFYETYFRPNIGYLAVVGDITPEEARPMVEKYFGKWQPGEVPKPTYDMPKPPAKTTVVVVDRPSSVQSMVYITHPVQLKPYTTESIQASLTNDILGGGGGNARLFNNLREKHGYTYGAYSTLTSDRLVGRFRANASVRNAVTDSAVGEFINELKNIRNSKPSADELKSTKNTFAGNFIFTLEDPETIADFAINTARYHLPEDFFSNYLKSVDAVTVDQVEASANKLIDPEHAYIVVVGKGSEVADKLKRFGDIVYYDLNGNKVDAPTPGKLTTSAVPAGLTADQVFDKYLTAIGGKDAIAKITDVTQKLTTEVQGTKVDIESRQKGMNKFKLSVKAMGQVVQQVTSDGVKVKLEGGGQSKSVADEEARMEILKNAIFPELLFATMGAKTVLAGTEKINGKDAYKIDVTLGKKTISEFYDVETGLKVQYTAIEQGPQGEMAVNTGLSNYKEVNGVKFANTLTQNLGPMTMKMETQSLVVNTGLDDKEFAVQ